MRYSLRARAARRGTLQCVADWTAVSLFGRSSLYVIRMSLEEFGRNTPSLEELGRNTPSLEELAKRWK